MKLAILVAGQYRQHAETQKTWRFLQEFDCDLYIATWNRNPLFNIEVPLTEAEIRNTHPSARVALFDEGETQLSHNCKLIFLWKRAVEMIEGNYDAVLLIRPDLFLDINQKVLERELSSVTDNDVYLLIKDINHADDTLLFSTQTGMCNLVQGLDYSVPDGLSQIHRWLDKKLSGFNLKESRGFLRAGIRRQSLIKPLR